MGTGITIKDVARKVGVTPATVSMVINNKPRISEATRRRVFQAIRELDYVPHEGARNLVLKRHNTIGVAAPFFSSHFFLQTLTGIEEGIRGSAFNLVLYATGGEDSDEGVVARMARERRVDGLIAVNLAISPAQRAAFKKSGLSVVNLENELEGFDSVCVDNRQGALQATRHLLQLGHRRIALVNGPLSQPPAALRLQGFDAALREAGIKPEAGLMHTAPTFSRDEGAEAAQALFRRPQPPTAVFVAAGDVCATGVLLALRGLGLRVPQDVSVVGFDDQPFAQLTDPPLSTVRQPMAAMGAKALAMLVAAIAEGASHKPQRASFQAELLPRGSSGPPREA